LRTNEAKPGLGYCCPAVRTSVEVLRTTGLRFSSVTLGPATTQPRNVLLHFARSLSADGKQKKELIRRHNILTKKYKSAQRPAEKRGPGCFACGRKDFLLHR